MREYVVSLFGRFLRWPARASVFLARPKLTAERIADMEPQARADATVDFLATSLILAGALSTVLLSDVASSLDALLRALDLSLRDEFVAVAWLWASGLLPLGIVWLLNRRDFVWHEAIAIYALAAGAQIVLTALVMLAPGLGLYGATRTSDLFVACETAGRAECLTRVAERLLSGEVPSWIPEFLLGSGAGLLLVLLMTSWAFSRALGSRLGWDFVRTTVYTLVMFAVAVIAPVSATAVQKWSELSALAQDIGAGPANVPEAGVETVAPPVTAPSPAPTV